MKAAIFDMDGLLIDSEPYWRRAKVAAFRPLGVPLTEEMCFRCMGLRIDEVVTYWFQRHPWQGASHQQVEQAIMQAVIQEMATNGQPMPGVRQTLELMRAAGLRIALASSSPMSLIETVVTRLDIGEYFELLCSAADEPRGKPDPAVYLTTAAKLALDPCECFALEDSFAGVTSATSAGMKVIAIPAPEEQDDPRFDLAHCRLRSLEQIDQSWLNLFLHRAA